MPGKNRLSGSWRCHHIFLGTNPPGRLPFLGQGIEGLDQRPSRAILVSIVIFSGSSGLTGSGKGRRQLTLSALPRGGQFSRLGPVSQFRGLSFELPAKGPGGEDHTVAAFPALVAFFEFAGS
jgi:hypothetical protein